MYQHKVTTAELIYQIGQMEGQIIQYCLADIGIRMEHARLLHYVSDVPGTNLVNLANYLNVQPATLTNMIKKLEKQELIIRHVDPDDSHQRQLFLLPQGEVVAKQINAIFHELNDVVDEVHLKDSAQLSKLLNLLESKKG
ncbi:MarR family transcriptional regulator [Lactobacillus sp. UCMA15818]|uniref:MarR family winged helix-turn-helix transcriptional regulator n=1 Tax=Lactobacillus sp. UCMA15818 TaxID=2583394 RepID=UPI0025B1FA88|nr:MarR family transcriptional regulator [Lactobacillus sp. UCMA15818]MDN2453265.1 MarR family transcriptional regulator [Lactobacillus sp. UCMA15818]